MTQKKYHLVFIILVSVLTSGAVAAGNYLEKKQDKREISQDKKELGTTSATLDRLSVTIDRWVETNLTGHNKKANSYEESILAQIKADIASSQRQLERFEAEVHSSAKEYNHFHQSPVAHRDDRADLRDDVKDLHLARRLLKEKERLASSLHKAKAFSNKYRLLGDYMEVMRRELDIVRVELAEDVNELHEDKVKGRREYHPH
jgi:hypothetical protein